MNSSLLSAALDVPSLGHRRDGDDDSHNHDSNVALSPPSGVASYHSFHPPQPQQHLLPSNGSSSAMHDSLSSSFIPASSISSFDTPRIDNIHHHNVNGHNNSAMAVAPISALSSGSMSSWMTNSSSINNTQHEGEDDYLFRHSDFTLPTSNILGLGIDGDEHDPSLRVALPPPPSLQSNLIMHPDPLQPQRPLRQKPHHETVIDSATRGLPAQSKTTNTAGASAHTTSNGTATATTTTPKRSIMGRNVAKKYRFHTSNTPDSKTTTSPMNKLPTMRLSPHRQAKQQQQQQNRQHHDLLLQPPPPPSPSHDQFITSPPTSPSAWHNINNPNMINTAASTDDNTHDIPTTPTKTPTKAADDHMNEGELADAPTITVVKSDSKNSSFPQHPQALSPLTPAYPHHGSRNIKPTTTSHPTTTATSTGPASLSSSRMQPRVLPMSYQNVETPNWDYQDEIDDMDHVFRYKDSKIEHCANGRRQHHAPATTAYAVHETIHAQSLLLGLAFMSVWLPNNVMAPNLTQMAEYFDMSNEDRDQYLGSYCALAVGVFSLPISGGIGFLSDIYSRKHLFLACVLFGAVSSAWTGYSRTYWSLFFARLVSGGCMSGSVPVAFSLLGDLFSTAERNAASSGLTAMMGLGIIAGQVYAGMVGPIKGWQYPFYVAAVLQLITAVVMAIYVAEPIRGGTEKCLQNVQYNRKLTWQGFVHAMHNNASNSILIWQGFVTSIPWGVVLVFLNDYLSQEKGFSVPEATVLVMLFGIGCGVGGVLGGYFGGLLMSHNRSYLPLYMAATTFLGIIPFLFLLNTEFPHHNGYKAKFLSIVGGTVASLPSVNVRPCIINVNLPETRGAALTAANLLVTVGRGIGPACIVLMGSIFSVSRQTAFNVTLTVFWAVSALQLVLLAKTLPIDMDAMEAALEQCAANAQGSSGQNGAPPSSPVKTETSSLLLPSTPGRNALEDGDTILSIDDLTTSFDVTAARRSLQFVRLGIQELNEEITLRRQACRVCENSSEEEDNTLNDVNNSVLEEEISDEEIQRRRDVWLRQQQQDRE